MTGRPWSGPLVLRAVRSRAVRLVIAVSGVAVSTLLVLVLAAGYRSVTVGVTSYVGQDRIDLWVAPLGTDNLIRSSGMLPSALVPLIKGVEGVESADPMLRGFVAMTSEHHRRHLSALAIGYLSPDGLGAPPNVTSGRCPASDGEVTLDRAAAYRLGAKVDDSISINGRPFEVVGLSSGTNLLATQFVFLNGASAARAAGIVGRVSYIGVKVAAGIAPAEVKQRIEEQEKSVQVFDRAEWVKNNVNEVAAGFLPLLILLSVVGAVSATLLVALLVQGAVDDRRRDIAILLALGTPASVVGRAVVLHAASLVMGGALIGAVLTLGLKAILEASTPLVALAPRVTDLLWVLAAFGAASLLATLIPLLRLRRIDPAEAFRP